MYTPQTLVAGEYLDTSTTVLYTAPDLAKVRVSAVTVVNTDLTANQSFSIYFAPDASAATSQYAIITQKVLAPGESYSVYQAQNQVLKPAGTLQASGSAAGKLALYASGTEITA